MKKTRKAFLNKYQLFNDIKEVHLKSCRDEFREVESIVYISLKPDIFMNIFINFFTIS